MLITALRCDVERCLARAGHRWRRPPNVCQLGLPVEVGCDESGLRRCFAAGGSVTDDVGEVGIVVVRLRESAITHHEERIREQRSPADTEASSIAGLSAH